MPKPDSGAARHQETTGDWSVQEMFSEYVASARLAEVVYRDAAGQVVVVHDVIRDFFCRAGRDFMLLGRGRMLSLDHVIMVDGRQLVTSRE